MPHIIMEYSLGGSVGGARLLDRLHAALGETEGFERDRIKSRAVEVTTHRVGSEGSTGFVHATVAFSRGRPEAVRRGLGRRLLGILIGETRALEPHVSRSVEIRQFEPGMYFNDRDHASTVAGRDR